MDRVDFPQGIERVLNTGNLIGSSVFGNAKTENRKTRGKAGLRESQKSDFSEILDRSILEAGALGPLTETPPSEEAAQELLDAVQSTGNNLKRRPLPDELLDYKKAVRSFLYYVVENGFEFREFQGIMKKTTFGGKSEWKAKVFHQVRIVDQKLNQLAADILTRHISELDLQSKIEEITGLLVDLTVTGKIRERDG